MRSLNYYNDINMCIFMLTAQCPRYTEWNGKKCVCSSGYQGDVDRGCIRKLYQHFQNKFTAIFSSVH